MQVVNSAYPQFVDLNGSPLNNGSIYIGVENQNPEVSPVAVYWDSALTQGAVQPLKTINGLICRDGTPANVYTSGDYSLSVKNKKNLLLSYNKTSATFSIWSSLSNFIASVASSIGSSLIGHLPSGVGALVITVQNQLRNIQNWNINVMDAPFYAKGDGVADDTLAIQNAINTGGVIKFPPGTYKVTSLSLVGKSAILIGSGESKTIIKSSATSPIIDLSETSDKVLLPASIFDMQLDGNSIATYGIKTRYRHKTFFRNVTINNVNGDALNELDSWNNLRYNLTLNSNINGLVLQGANNNCKFVGISASSNTQYQLKIMNGGTVAGGSTALAFDNCDIEYATGFGIYVNTTGVVRFNDCYIGEGIDGTVFDMAAGTVIVSGGFAYFGALAASYLGNLVGGKLLFKNVSITGGALASISNMFTSGNGRALIEDSPCYVTASGTQVMNGDVLDYGKSFDTFVSKLGRLFTGFCLNGTFSQVTTSNEITVTCLTTTGSPTLLEVHANIVPNWKTGQAGALIITYSSTKPCTARLTSGSVGITPAISIIDTLPATGGQIKTAVMFNWTYTNAVYPPMLEIFQNSTVPGDTLTVNEVFLTDVKSSKVDPVATFYNLGKC